MGTPTGWWPRRRGLRRDPLRRGRLLCGLLRGRWLPRGLGGLLAVASIALSGCGAAHRLDRAQERRLLGDIASARRAAAAHDRPGATAALERFLAAVDQLRHRGTLTPAQATALTSQADGALKVALAMPALSASPGAGKRSTTFTGEDSGAVHTGTGAAAQPASPNAHAQTPPGAKPHKPSSPPSGAGQGPAQPNGPHGGPGQDHQPPGQARKHNDGSNDNQGGDG